MVMVMVMVMMFMNEFGAHNTDAFISDYITN